MSDEVLHCIEAGMDAYLVKPMDLNSLAAELKRWLPMPGGLQAGLA
jgi:CheY-like chemotaxis protein